MFSEEQIKKIRDRFTWKDISTLDDLLLALKGLKLVVELEPDRHGQIRACRVFFGSFYKSGQWRITKPEDIKQIAQELTDEVVVSVIELIKDALAEAIDSE